MTAAAVSVIVPAFNSGETISASLRSVWSQTISPLEVIVVDDCSTDGTREVVEEEAREENGLRLVRMEENRGPAAARNRGISGAQGDWIAFLDGDDVWLPGHLGVLTEVAEQYPDAGLVCGAVVSLRDEGGADRLVFRSPGKGGRETGQAGDKGWAAQRSGVATVKAETVAENTQRIPLREFALRNPIATSAAMVKKSVLDEVGGFDESFRGPEDYDLWMRIAAEHPVARTSVPVTQYREQTGSLSMDDRRFLSQVLSVFDKAFGDEGVLREFGDLRPSAESGQYWNASWMAFSRGDRKEAMRHLMTARKLSRCAGHKGSRPWLRMLARYALGRCGGMDEEA